MISDNGWQAASFVLSLMTWRQTRAGSPQVTIRRGDVEVTVPSGNPEEAARIAVLLQQAAQISPVDSADGGSERQDSASGGAASGDDGDSGTTAGIGDDGEGREG